MGRYRLDRPEETPAEETPTDNLAALEAVAAAQPSTPLPPVVAAEPVDDAATAANDASAAGAAEAARVHAEENRILASLPPATLQAAGVTNGMSRAEIIRRVTALHRG